ncbi:MAG: glycosyl transferase family 2 [Gammaproteobacteria bacterium]|nr:MAG: glycosyl transferase family 2 [Gammaproteobacteria bacterium]
MELISIVIRTLDEGRYLDELLSSAFNQKLDPGMQLEVVIIDSGSTDDTLSIAERHGCRITHIDKSEFTFGRSLNRGSEYANGDVLIYVSGHCIPEGQYWLANLVAPVVDGRATYVYGRQIGCETTKYSENKLFGKYFPGESKIPQADIFCNNANAAILRDVWEEYRFDEEVTGLEDMELGRRLLDDGCLIAYTADAMVYHIHDESWIQTKRRYEREAIALQKIMPDVHVSFLDMLRYLVVSVAADFSSALAEKCFLRESVDIVKFRIAQYWGAYRGNHEHRQLSRKRKENYYYPNKVIKEHHR